MTEQRRVCLIEVGSYSIRFWIADFDEHWKFRTVFVDEEDREIRHFVNPEIPDERDIASVNVTVSHLLDKAREFRCDLVAAFGTALCRRIDEVHPGKLSKGIRVLSKAEEALAALAAGSICEGGRIRNGEVIVVDEGTGSTEIAQGLWTAGGMKNVKSVSFDIGSARLSEMFKAAPSEYLGSIQKHLQYIDERIRESGMNISQSGRLYLLGGVATKIAWLQVRRSPSEYYKPSLVNGFSYPCSRLIDEYKDLYGRYESNPVAAAEYVDDRPEREDEVLRVLSGLPFLALVLLRVYGGQLIRTSAFSIRHGVTFLVCAGALRL